MSCWVLFKSLVKNIPGTVWLYESIQDKWKSSCFSRSGKVLRKEMQRGPKPKLDLKILKQNYIHSALNSEPDTFALCRIIGNDLEPRHKKGQSYDNLKFILENEHELDDCTKFFVVNRIVDAEQEEKILCLLNSKDIPYLRIPFEIREYHMVAWDIEGVPIEFAPFTKQFSSLDPAEQKRIMMRIYRHKNNYVMNNNGARNAALRYGKKLAKWVLPWDGNCFLTEQGWLEIVHKVKSSPEFPYFISPMARVTDNLLLLDPEYRPEANEEPQIIFRRDSALEFNEEYFYGRRPKVELLWRLGVPGNWDTWKLEPWDLDGPVYSKEAGCFGYAGWVARLESGRPDLETDPVQGKVERGLARNSAIETMLNSLNKKNCWKKQSYISILGLPPVPKQPRLDKDSDLMNKLFISADNALLKGPYSVVQKSTLPPSLDPHDYWHPAPYYWPNPMTASGLPYVSRDGQRVPGTRLYEPESDKYDRTRLQRLFDDTTVLALAWKFFQNEAYARHAAKLVHTWFLNPETSMNPHLKYAQVRMGHNNNMGSNSGLIEMKDLYFFLDAVKILINDGFISPGDHNELQKWFEAYLEWLISSDQGIKERSAPNNHGLYYDLQVASIAAFLEDEQLVRSALRDSMFRILQHFDSDGHQPHEMKRTTTAHYCCFNLQGWIHMAQLAESFGEDLWNFQGSDGKGIKAGMHWLLTYLCKEWPFQQIDKFDRERFYPIYYACMHKYGLPEEVRDIKVPDPSQVKPLFFPHDGVRPFWQVGLDEAGQK